MTKAHHLESGAEAFVVKRTSRSRASDQVLLLAWRLLLEKEKTASRTQQGSPS